MIKVYTGPMFSGKSTNLILDFVMLGEKANPICFKPRTDTREYSKISARDADNELQAVVIDRFEDIEKYVAEDTTDIFIDEAQFMEGDPSILLDLSIKNNISIRIAGLSRTSELKPFGHMPELLALADDIKCLVAMCDVCGGAATYTHCKTEKSSNVMVGNSEYEPLCFDCYRKKINRQ